jgi:hypothetical protein
VALSITYSCLAQSVIQDSWHENGANTVSYLAVRTYFIVSGMRPTSKGTTEQDIGRRQ